MNLFDIMRQAGGGDAFARLGGQYGLSEEQITQAVQAFMPAFSAGLKRSTADPLGLMEFMRRLATGGFGQAYQNPAWASGAGRPQGEEALSFLFGSPEAARAIAAQASAFTGLAQDKLAELLPALAAVMFGGLAKQATAANPVLDAMMKQFHAAAAGSAGAAKGPLDRYEAEEAQRDGTADFARMQGDMLKAGLSAFQAGTAAWQQTMGEMMKSAGGGAVTGTGARPETEASGRDLFGEMFEPGLRLSEAYQREMESLMARLRPDTTRS
jgi:hypothetical protein